MAGNVGLIDINDINDKVLLCSICHERFQTPKTLGCLHSFCLKCIEGWVKKNGGVLSCPMCRRKFDVPNKGLIGLPSSYFINQLLEYTADVERDTLDVNRCVTCNTNATAHCIECSVFLCKQCAQSHCKLLPCRGHNVMPLEKYKSMDAKERAAAKPVMCPNHKDVAVEFYCCGCFLPVCMKCTVVSHKGHNLQELHTALERFKEDAKQLLTFCSTKESEVKAELEQHLQNTEAEKKSVSKCAQDVNYHAQRLHQMVDAARDKLLADLDTLSKADLQNRQQEKVVKEEKIVQLQNTSMFIDSLLHAPQPIVALFDSNETLTEARKIFGKQTEYEEDKYMVPVAGRQRRLKNHKGFKQDVRVVDDTNSDDSKSFYFQENSQLTRMFVHSIGSVNCRFHNPLRESAFGAGGFLKKNKPKAKIYEEVW